MAVTPNELNLLLGKLDIDLDDAYKKLLLNYSKKRGLDVNELRSDISKTGIDKLLSVRAPRFLRSSVLSFNDFLDILKRNGIHLTLSHAEIREMYEIFMSMHKENVRNMDGNTVNIIFKGAKKYMIASADKFVPFAQIKDFIKNHQTETDLKLYQAFYRIDQKFKETNLSGEKLPVDALIKKCYKKAQQVCAELNVEEDALTDDVINIIWSLACIYNSLVNYTSDLSRSTSTRLSAYAEKLLQERILSKSTLFYKDLINYYPDTKFESTQMYYFEEFLNSLMNNPDADKDELFNEQDVYELINHTPYLVFVANKQKLEGARIALNYYMEAVLKDFPKIKRKTTKDMFKKAGTILDNSPIANENAVHLLLGEDIGSILKLNFGKDDSLSPKKKKKQEYMQLSFGNMRISGMDFNKHSFVLNNRNSIFTTLTIENMYDCIANVLNLTCDALDIDEQYLATKRLALERHGFNVAEMFTGDNIFDLFDVSSKFMAQTNEKRDDLENYKQNIKILSSLIAMPDVFKIVQHNFKFLTQNNLSEYAKIISASKTQEELRLNLEHLINSKAKSSGRASGNSTAGEGKTTKLQKTKIELGNLDIDVELLKKLGFNCQFDVKEKPKKSTTSPKTKKDTATIDLVGDLNKLENDINNTEDVDLPIYVEEDLPEEPETEIELTSPYDDWAKLQFEMSAISEYFANLTALDASKQGWYKSGSKTNTHIDDSVWLEVYPTFKDTLIYDLVERNTSQYISPFMSGKISVKAIDKSLNEMFARILAVKNEIIIDKHAIDDTIECLNSIISAKQADKQTLMHEVITNSTNVPESTEQPNYLGILLERTKALAKSAKQSKVSGLVKASAEQIKELKNAKSKAKSDPMSAYNQHRESKKSATAAIEECQRLSKFIEALETIRDSFENFKKEINKVEVVSESQPQVDEETMQRIEALEQEIYSLKQSIAKRENYIKGLQGAQKSGTKDHVLKVQRQLDAQYKKLEELENELQSLNDNLLPN